ncbi:hypothetical protein L4X63_20560 [Geomonas sp. Red32]|uniref:hypothetical protein n=1 Tax=Geomonas sp. Red32 TaxID=2912856 RepID=UPI00202D0C46|nr:hypothetical protein [Geomonas sp. Red32]MCM0083978.1 hypothetical protein [Geomonas sp. Red32]
MLSLIQTIKGGRILSTPAFGLFGLDQLPKSNLYPGRRPKIKAAPKVKVKKGKIAGLDHGSPFASLVKTCQEKTPRYVIQVV